MKYTVKQLSEKIYSCGYCLILIAFLLQISNTPNVFPELYSTMRILRILGYFCCLIKLLLITTWKKRSILQIVVAFLCIGAVTFVTDSQIILTDLFLIITSKNVNMRSLMKRDLLIRVLFGGFTILLCVIGVVPDILDYRNGVLSRHSLGFAHPNRLALHLFMITLYLFYINYNRIKVKHLLAMLFLDIFALISTDGRTSCLGIFIVFLLSVFKWKNKEKLIIEYKSKIYAPFVYVISILFSFLSPVLYLTGNLHTSADSTFGSRIVMAARGLSAYGIKIFGQKVEVVTSIVARLTGQQANGIDNMYVYLAVNFGILVFVLFIFMLWKGISFAEKAGDKAGVICFLLIIIMGIMENQFLYIESNLFLIYIGQYWLTLSQKKRRTAINGEKYEYAKG